MRILNYVDVLRLEEGGVVRAALDLSQGLAQAGADITLLTGDAHDAPEPWRSTEGGSLSVATIDRSLTPLLSPKNSAEVLREAVEAADVVHLHTLWDPFNPAVAAAATAAGKPYVLSVHGMLDDWCMTEKGAKKRVYLALKGRRLLERAAWLHFTAQAESEQALRWAPRAKPLVVPLLMDLSPYERLPGPDLARERFPQLADESSPRLLFLSRVDPKKGIDLLIRAMARLPADGPQPIAFIAGPGEPDYVAELQRLAEQSGVADRVHFLGMIKGDLKWSLYQACDLFVLPTHQENFGIVLVEAMACGLPVLTTRRVDIWQELERHGALITEDNEASWLAGMRSAIDRLPLAEDAARRARDGVLEWLEPEGVTQQLMDNYRSAIEAAG